MRTAVLVLSAALLAAPAVTAQTTTAAAGKATGSREAARKGRVDVNSATDRELERLPGVTPAIARKIIQGRPYASLSDLSHAGLTKAQVRKLAPHVLVGSPAAKPARTKPR